MAEANLCQAYFNANQSRSEEHSDKSSDRESSGEVDFPDPGQIDEHMEDWRNDPDDRDQIDILRDASIFR